MRKHILAILLFIPVFAHAGLKGKALADSLLLELNNARQDSDKVLLLKKVSHIYQTINTDEGVKYGAQALALAEKIGWKKGIAYAANAIGVNYLNSSDYSKATEYISKALAINEERSDNKAVAANLGNLANIYETQGDLVLALEYQFKVLKLLGDKDFIQAGNCLMNIGNIYITLKDYSKAHEYYSSALAKFEQAKDRAGIAGSYANIGSCLHLQGANDKALDRYKKAVTIYGEDGDIFNEQVILGNIGDIYLDQKDYANSQEFYFRALKKNDTVGDKEGLATLMAGIGRLYLQAAIDNAIVNLPTNQLPSGKQVRLNKAVEYLESAKKIAEEIGNIKLMVEIYQNLSTVYNLIGRQKEALNIQFDLLKLKDSLLSIDDKLKIATLETKRERELKDKQIEINLVQGIKERNERIFYVFGIGLLSILVIVILRNNSIQKRINKQLEIEKKKSDQLALDVQTVIKKKELLTAKLAEEVSNKSRFLANISHELRTPVTLLTGMLEILKGKKNNANYEEQKQLAIAYDYSVKLQRMVGEILDITKLENNGELKIRSEIKEVSPLLHSIVHAFAPLLEQKGIALEYLDDAKGLYVQVDVEKFEKIINNLIFNAIKFNVENGWIQVVIRSSPDNNSVLISVSDSGVGISEKDQQRIFERYYQGSATANFAGGSGIGLSLVKEFTSLLGGNISLLSGPEEGTTFTLQFPVSKLEHKEPEIDDEELLELPAESWDSFSRQPLVLLVEDNTEMRYYLKKILDDKVKVAEATNGLDALTWLASNSPDLIISDIMMPEMDGRELIAKIKSNEEWKKIPVITLSALADPENEMGMLRLGIDDYIVKPFNAAELRIRVYNLLKNLLERTVFNEQQPEADDIPLDSLQAEEFRNKITAFVLARIKNTNVSVSELAFELSLSERQLYRLAKSLTGYTPAQLIKEVRLKKAYEILLTGQVSKIDDLAKRVGFENSGYFSRQFLNRFGKRPAEFL